MKFTAFHLTIYQIFKILFHKDQTFYYQPTKSTKKYDLGLDLCTKFGMFSQAERHVSWW